MSHGEDDGLKKQRNCWTTCHGAKLPQQVSAVKNFFTKIGTGRKCYPAEFLKPPMWQELLYGSKFCGAWLKERTQRGPEDHPQYPGCDCYPQITDPTRRTPG